VKDILKRLDELEERIQTVQAVQRAYERFDILERRLDELMEMLKHHTYVGVPEQFRVIRGILMKIAEELGVRE